MILCCPLGDRICASCLEREVFIPGKGLFRFRSSFVESRALSCSNVGFSQNLVEILPWYCTGKSILDLFTMLWSCFLDKKKSHGSWLSSIFGQPLMSALKNASTHQNTHQFAWCRRYMKQNYNFFGLKYFIFKLVTHILSLNIEYNLRKKSVVMKPGLLSVVLSFHSH